MELTVLRVLLVKWKLTLSPACVCVCVWEGGYIFWTLLLPKECLALSVVIYIYMSTYMENLEQRCDSDLVSDWKWSTQNILLLNLFPLSPKDVEIVEA